MAKGAGFTWTPEIFGKDNIPLKFPEDTLQGCFPDAGAFTSATLFKQTPSGLAILGASPQFIPGGTAVHTIPKPGELAKSPELLARAVDGVKSLLTPPDQARLSQVFESPDDFDVALSLASPLVQFPRIRVIRQHIGGTLLVLLVALARNRHEPNPNHLDTLREHIHVTLEERDLEVAFRALIPPMTTPDVVDFPATLHFHRHARTLVAGKIKIVERYYTGGTTISASQEPIEEADRDPFRLRARVRGLPPAKAEALLRSFFKPPLTQQQQFALGGLSVELGLYLANLDRLGVLSIPMGTLMQHKPNYFTTLAKRACLKIPSLPLVSDFTGYTRYWDTETLALSMEAGPAICERFGETPDTQRVVPVWNFSAARREIFQRGRTNDPLLVDKQADVGLIVLRGNPPAEVVERTLCKDLRKLGVEVLGPETLADALSQL